MNGTISQNPIAGKPIAMVLVLAVMIASAFSVAPHLHERFHGAAPHDCVATLISSGHCHLVRAAPCLTLPTFWAGFTTVISGHSQSVSSELECSLLEHAPPALS